MEAAGAEALMEVPSAPFVVVPVLVDVDGVVVDTFVLVDDCVVC